MPSRYPQMDMDRLTKRFNEFTHSVKILCTRDCTHRISSLFGERLRSLGLDGKVQSYTLHCFSQSDAEWCKAEALKKVKYCAECTIVENNG